MENVKKFKYVIGLRSLTDKLLLSLPLPKINPDIVSALSVILSIFFILYSNLTYQIIMLVLIIFLDWLDGLIAKKHQYRKNEKEKEKGWMIDVFADRLSEGIISIIYFMPFFFLFFINCILSLWSYKSKKHFILPVRAILLLYLIIKLFI